MAYDGTSNFSEDADLLLYEYTITELLATSQSEANFNNFHIDARRKILNKFKFGEHRDIFWDNTAGNDYDFTIIFDEDELKPASCFWVLYLIWYRKHLSGDPEGLFLEKSDNYLNRFNKEMNSLSLSIDEDMDGVIDFILTFGSTRILRA